MSSSSPCSILDSVNLEGATYLLVLVTMTYRFVFGPLQALNIVSFFGLAICRYPPFDSSALMLLEFSSLKKVVLGAVGSKSAFSGHSP
jgi:hypothetical protein